MAVLGVKIKNYKKFKDLQLVLDGHNVFFCGDSATGKTTVIDLIKAANMQTDFPTNPLTDGEEAGAVEIIQDMDGKKYRIFRKFKKGDSGRWEIRNEDGSKPAKSLTDILTDLLGRALKNGYFDYQEYFFKLKSKGARYEYFVNAVGGQEVANNNKAIANKKKERATFGNQKTQQEAIYMQMGTLDKTQLESLFLMYQKEKTSEDADKVYNDIHDTAVDIKPLATTINNLESNLKLKNLAVQSITEWDEKIEQLKAEIVDLENKNKFAANVIKENKNVEKELETANAVFEKTKEDNEKIIEKADQAYKDEIDKVIIFNSNRKTFQDSIRALNEFNRVSAEWDKINDEITALEAENSELFKQKLPIPELSVSSIEKKNKNGDIEIEEVVMYNGREFSFDELSKGESIEITAKIQKALNPKGNNFIVLPEANLLGSKLDDIIEECKKQNIQALVEITQRKQEFKIVFDDEFLK